MDRNIADTASILQVLGILEGTVKEILRREKTMSPVLLMQPFAEIGLMLESDRYRSLPGREEILAGLRRILSQFSVFGGVTARLEEEGEVVTDTTASFKEDLPYTSHGRQER